MWASGSYNSRDIGNISHKYPFRLRFVDSGDCDRCAVPSVCVFHITAASLHGS
jgi:hypothetical protein